MIKRAVNDRYGGSHSTEDIIMVINMIEMNKYIINRVLLPEMSIAAEHVPLPRRDDK
jgi:hypothetical protein